MGDGVGTLHVMVGLPACGKTTAARRLQHERGAVRLTPDEWMKPIFGRSDADGARDVMEGRFIALALDLLRLGVDVVLDFGVWSSDERWALRALADELGARCELVYLPVHLDEQLARITVRNVEQPATTFDISEQELRHYASQFDVPDDTELAGGAIPAPPAGYDTWRQWAAQRWPTSIN